MADLEERRISDLTRALEVDSSALFEVSNPDESAESGYSSMATDVETMAQKMLGGINFETQLQTNAKNIFGAINEANQHGGGGGGSDVAMSDNPNGGVDLDVEGTTRTLAKQETIDGVVAIEENEEVDEIDVVEPSDIANIQLQLGNVFGEILTYTNITIDGVGYNNANVKMQTLTVSNTNSKGETENNNAFSLAQMISTDNTTLKNKFVTGRALLCYQTSDGSASGWKSFYFDSETPPIVVDKIYDQSLTLEASAYLNVTIPSKAGYTAIGLGACYCGGTMSYSFLMDTETRVFIKNITTQSRTLQTRISIIYARN